MGIGRDIDALTVREIVVKRYDMAIYLCYGELIAELRVYRIGEVYRSRSLREGDDIPFRCEYENLIRKYIHMHL